MDVLSNQNYEITESVNVKEENSMVLMTITNTKIRYIKEGRISYRKNI
ncbi:MAG: hypothetical protein J1F31_05880 [Erysipelotrichales bacterium]|nr:hypothetical protein [Erysipelotrichales bacterium]